MLRQPLLKVRELYRSWLLERSRSEPAHPVVVHAQGCGYGAVLAHALPDSFTSPPDALFYPFGG